MTFRTFTDPHHQIYFIHTISGGMRQFVDLGKYSDVKTFLSEFLLIV